MPAVLFPDVEAWVIGYLQVALNARDEPFTDGVWVGNHAPETLPPRTILVRDDGGPRLGDVRAVARLGVQVWAGVRNKGEGESFDLANLTSTLVASCANGSPVVRATAGRPYSVEDPRPKHYFTAELLIRGTEL